MKRALSIALLSLLVLAVTATAAKQRRDPLTPVEADQMRDVAQEPLKRIKLIVKFARARLLSIEQLRADPAMASARGQRIHDLLEDFTAIVDELDDNVNMYYEKKWDVAKALPEVITADSEFQGKLRALKDSAASDPAAAREAADYHFILENAIDAVNASLDNTRDVQGELAKESAEEKAARKKRSQ